MDVICVSFAEEAFENSENGKLTIQEIFDTIVAPDFPCMRPRFYFVYQCLPSAGELDTTQEITVKLIDADGNDLFVDSRSVTISKAQTTFRGLKITGILPLEKVTFPKEGEYAMCLMINGQPKSSLPLYVIKRGK